MIRPEAQKVLWRWHEVLIGLLLVAVGGYFAFTSWGLMRILAGFACLLGALLIHIGWLRAKFRRDPENLGVITCTEGEIAYSGPFHGAHLTIESLEQISLITINSVRYWQLRTNTKELLSIPTHASGSEALLDAFSLLPGVNLVKFATSLERELTEPIIIWQRP